MTNCNYAVLPIYWFVAFSSKCSVAEGEFWAMWRWMVLFVGFTGAISQADAQASCAWPPTEQSIDFCSKFIATNPRAGWAYMIRGGAYHKRGDYDRAIADYSKAIEINPRDTSAYASRGITYGYKRKTDERAVDFEIADYTKAIEMETDLKNAATYSYYRAGAYVEMRDYERAISDYSKAIEFNPAFSLAYLGRASAYERKAVADYSRAIEINPSDFLARAGLKRLSGVP